jgi:hypothetical protein
MFFSIPPPSMHGTLNDIALLAAAAAAASAAADGCKPA